MLVSVIKTNIKNYNNISFKHFLRIVFRISALRKEFALRFYWCLVDYTLSNFSRTVLDMMFCLKILHVVLKIILKQFFFNGFILLNNHDVTDSM